MVANLVIPPPLSVNDLATGALLIITKSVPDTSRNSLISNSYPPKRIAKLVADTPQIVTKLVADIPPTDHQVSYRYPPN